MHNRIQNHAAVTGEPVASKRCTAGSGRGPLEKELLSRNLASGLPVLLHGVPPGREFSLRLISDGSLLRVEVRDSGGGQVEMGHGRAGDLGGRGLHLVKALSDDFGVMRHVPGKTVWLVFKTDSADGEVQ
ncbi:ATP-binding protein [Streptomyces sp. NPDC050617]|uniref:ATP-binding protein n=1 Tax=Streptomyces sp. NPDC050617 TaxID=3154628 RepID=UPI003448860D